MKLFLRRSRGSFGRRCAVAATAAVLGTALSASVGVSHADDPGRPGDVVHVEPSGFPVAGMPTPVDAWKILYRSTDPLDNPIVVSGRVFVPRDGRVGTRPLVTYAVGTVGMGDQCAPSATGGPHEISELLEEGWAVVATDYPGLGTPGDHPYLVGRSEGAAVLDAARAAQRLPEANSRGVVADSPVGIVGYSQGGHSSSWAAEMAHDYAPELDIKGVVAGGVPASTVADAKQQMGKAGNPAGAMMVAIGHDAVYPELHLDSYLTDEGRKLAHKVRTGCVLDNIVAGEGKSHSQLFTSDPLDTPEWQQRLSEDVLGSGSLGFPAYVFHGTTDTIVPFEYGQRLQADWCRTGNTVEWHAIPVAEHMSAFAVGGGPALDWLGHRLAGQPAQGNCAG
ncbi:lipase family protein [Nocardia fluminea]|uniref:lipase family protein n=1 Tax=Nocardia fluminea TaxID=134984 RepID=UPI0033CE8ECA